MPWSILQSTRRKIQIPSLALGFALVSGCATTGPNYLYSTVEADPAVHALGPREEKISGAVAPGERVLGQAYDFNTDHLFLRVAPAQAIRVIERPSGKILREMPLPAELRTEASADLAIRSGDRHLFAVHPDGRSVMELTLFGEVVRRIELPGLGVPIGGLAFDQRRPRLLVLTDNAVVAFDLNGREQGRVTLHAPVNAVSLGYDSDAAHFFVPLANRSAVGEFDSAGNLIATLQVTPAGSVTTLDAGPRSLVRIF